MIERRPRGPRLAPALAGCAAAALLMLLLVPPAGAADPGLRFDVTIEGHKISQATASSPLPLHDDEDAKSSITVTNTSAKRVDIQTVRLDGSVAGLVFFGYLARIDLSVAPGATVTRAFTFDLGGLASQATGQVPARVQLLAPDRSEIAQTTFHADIDGSVTSSYGLFGIVVALITALLLVTSILRLISGTLSENRWSRAVRFGVCGIGVGMTVTYAASAFRVLTATTGTGLAFVVFCAGVGLAFGYLSPTPGAARGDGDTDEDIERDELSTSA